MSRKGWVLFVALGVIWGVPYLLIKVADRQISAPMLVEMRTGGAALLLLPIAFARHELRPVLGRWLGVLVFSIVEIDIPWVVLFSAERKLSSSLAGLLVAAVPIVGAVIAQLTGSSDRIDRRRLTGVLVGLGGVAALVGFAVGHSALWAAASMIVVVVGYALGPWILGHRLQGLPGLGVMAVALSMSAVVYAPIAAFSLPARTLTAEVIWSVVGLTLLCTALAFVLVHALVAEVGPVRATVITYVNPAVAVFLGVVVLHESFGWGTAVGFLLIIGGCILATGGSRDRQSPAIEAIEASETTHNEAVT